MSRDGAVARERTVGRGLIGAGAFASALGRPRHAAPDAVAPARLAPDPGGGPLMSDVAAIVVFAAAFALLALLAWALERV